MLPPIVAAGAITDSLGREWDPIKHPRDRKGKFIHTARLIRAFTESDGAEPWGTGEVVQINTDGSIRMKVQKVADQSHANYVGQLVDVTGDKIENINEKAKLNIFGKSKAEGPVDLGTYKFDGPEVGGFLENAGIEANRAPVMAKTASNIAAGNHNSSNNRDRYELALYAKSVSGDGKQHTDAEYMKLLEGLGVDSNLIDDTPDGMSGLKYLADEYSSGRSPNNNDPNGLDWFNELPPQDSNTLRTVGLRDSDVQANWNADGTQSISWPDGTEQQHDKNKGSLLEAVVQAHKQEGTKPDGSTAEIPPTNEPVPAVDEPTDENLVDEPIDFGSADVDTEGIYGASMDVSNSNSEYADSYAEALSGIAENLDSGSISNKEARVQLRSIADDIEEEGLDNEDAKLVKLGKSIRNEADALPNDGQQQKATLPDDVPLPEEEINLDPAEFDPTPDPEAPAVDDRPDLDELAKSDPRYASIIEYFEDSFETNDLMRAHGYDGLGPNVKKQVDDITSLMNETPLKQDEKVFRGIARTDEYEAGFSELLDNIKPGATIDDKAFLSTSRSNEVAQSFVNGHIDTDAEDVHGIMFEFNVPAGTPAFMSEDFKSEWGGEKEVVLPYGSKFIVDDAKIDESKIYRVTGRLLSLDEMLQKNKEDGIGANAPDAPDDAFQGTSIPITAQTVEEVGYQRAGGMPHPGEFMALDYESDGNNGFTVDEDTVVRVKTSDVGKVTYEYPDGSEGFIDFYGDKTRAVRLAPKDDNESGKKVQELVDSLNFSAMTSNYESFSLDGGPPSLAEKNAIKSYQGPGHLGLNSMLRGGSKIDGTYVQTTRDGLDSLLERSSMNTDTKVYRGIQTTSVGSKYLETYDGLVPGAIVSDKGFVSTSLDENIAQGFTKINTAITNKSILLEITVPAGTHAVNLPEVDKNSTWKESEVLLPRNSKIRIDEVVDEVQPDGSTRRRAKGTVVPDDYIGDENGAGPSQEEVGAPASPGADGVDAGPGDGDTSGSGPDDSNAGPSGSDAPGDEGSDGQPGAGAGTKFEVLADPGTSGDGYYPNNSGGPNLWGKYGAAGVMPRHVDENGVERFLMVQRGPIVSSNKGKWQLAGGALNSNENDYQGTARELFEELSPPDGFLEKMSPVGEVLFNHPSGWHYNNIAADVPEMFEPEVDGTETGDAGWFTREEIANLPLHPALEKNLDNIFSQFPETQQQSQGNNVPEPDVTPDSNEPLDATTWSQVGGQGGSNQGGMFEDPNGKRYYVKAGKTEDHARNEALAAALYEAAGVSSAQQLLTKTPFGGGKLGTASPEIPYSKQDLKQRIDTDPEYKKKLQEGFAVDAWLANWDVAGLVYDNVVTDADGNPVRVDPGGALYFRAQGAPKPGNTWGPTVGEFDTLRDPYMNPTSAKVFGDMSEEDLKASAQLVVNVTPDQIDSIVNSVGFGSGAIDPQTMMDTIKARRKFIADKYNLELPEDAVSTPDAPIADPVPEAPNAPDVTSEPTPPPKPAAPEVDKPLKVVDPDNEMGPGPGSTDFDNMIDGDGPYRWHPNGQKIRVGMKVKSQTDGLEGEIVKFEKNHDGVVVLGSDGKKRGRKIKKLDIMQATNDPAPEPTPTPDPVPTPATEPDPTPVSTPKPVIDPNDFMTNQNEAGKLMQKISSESGDVEITDDGDTLGDYLNALIEESDNGEIDYKSSAIQVKEMREYLEDNYSNTPEMYPLIDELSELELRLNGSTLPFNDLEDTEGPVSSPGGPLADWEKDLLGGNTSASLPQSPESDSPWETEMAINSMVDAYMDDSLPNNHKIFFGKSAASLQFERNNNGTPLMRLRNPGGLIVDEWDLSQMDSAGETKVDVLEMTNKLLNGLDTKGGGANGVEQKSMSEHMIALQDMRDGIPKSYIKVKEQYPYADDYQAKQYRNAGFAIDDALKSEPHSPEWNKAVSKAIVNLDNAGQAGTEKYMEVKNWYENFKLDKGVASPDVAPTGESYGVPIDSTELDYYGHDYVKTTEGSWESDTGPTIEWKSDAFYDIENYAKNPDIEKPKVTSTSTNEKYGSDANGHAIKVGDKVQSLSDGSVGTIVKFEANGTGVIVQGADGKKRGRKMSKLVNTDPFSTPYSPVSKMPNTESAESVAAKNALKNKVEPDPTSPWYGLPQPVVPRQMKENDQQAVSDDWLAKADENYKKRMKSMTPSWLEKPLSESTTYSSYVAVLQGDKSELSSLLAKGRITQELHDDALAQINKNIPAMLEKQNKYNKELEQWRADNKAWRKANGLPVFELRGMDTGAKKMGNAEAVAWMNKNHKAGSLNSQGKLSGEASSGISAQKGSNQSSDLRKLKEKSLDLAEVDKLSNAHYIKGLDAAVLESPPVVEDFITIRTFGTQAFIDPDTGGKHNGNISNVVGTIQHDWGFAETSPGSIDAGAYPGYTAGNVTMELRVPAGTRGVWTVGQNFGLENERGFILERGIAYYIHSVEKLGGSWKVKAEIIPKDQVDYDEFGHFVNQNPFFN